MEKAHEAKDLDLSQAARGVWLVKVPKYLSESWKKAGPNGEVGKLMITKSKTTSVKFCLNEQLSKSSSISLPSSSQPSSSQPNSSQSSAGKPAASEPIPIDHKFVLTGQDSQLLAIMSTEPIQAPGFANGTPNDVKVAIEGRVIQRAECRPIEDMDYVRFNKVRIEMKNKPIRQVQQLEKAVNSYKPKSAHASCIEYEQKKKEEGKKIRMDRQQVQDMLFGAFEKHQYYNVKDLVRVTNQPITYLKEILKEICTYNMKAPHKNMWELKPEYRHYKPTTTS